MISLQLSNDLKNLQLNLVIMQKNVIGFFKAHGTKHWEVVILEDDETLVTISIGYALGLIESMIDKKSGKYVKFPDNKNLSEMLNNPYEYYKFVDEYLK